MAVDWLKIKAEYVNGNISLRKLAEKAGISYSQIAKVSAAEKWTEAREEQRIKIESNTNQKTGEKIADLLSEEAAAKVRIRGKLIVLAEGWIDKQVKGIRYPGDFRRIVQSCVDLGIMDLQNSEDIDNDGLMDALGKVASGLFADGDDSVILPEESE